MLRRIVVRSLIWCSLLMASMALFGFAQTASAAINRQINFQGKLTNPDGTNVTNGTYAITANVYTVPSAGVAVWTEAHPTVTVTDGIFQISLGDTTSLPGSIDFNSNALYLGVTVNADPEMAPRIRLTAAPYALNSDQLDGIDSQGYVQLAQGLQVDASTTESSIEINKTGATANIMQLQRGGSDVLVIANNGAATFKNQADSSTAFLIYDQSNVQQLVVDTTLKQVQIGSVVADGVATLLVVDTKNTTGDPTGAVGAMYYNSFSSKFRCYEGAAWKDCDTTGGSSTLQTGYAAGNTISTTDARDVTLTVNDTATDANVLVNLLCVTACGANGRFAVQRSGTDVLKVNPNGSVQVVPVAAQDVATSLAAGSQATFTATAAPTESLVSVTNAGQAVATNNANGIGVNYVGGTGAIEGSGIRIDHTPGGTSTSTWNGMRIVANATGPVAGVTSNGLKIEGPTIPGAGTEVGISITTGFDIGLAIGSGGIQLTAQSEPAAPAAGNLRAYARAIAGRELLEIKGNEGAAVALQPGLFESTIQMITPSNTTAAVDVFGTTATSAGTLSLPTVTETYGYMKGFATAAAINSTAGTGATATTVLRGTSATGASGFFYKTRIGMPDASYAFAGAGTGTRTFVGLTSLAMATAVATDNPAGHRAGFSYVSVNGGRGDTNWRFSLKDGTTENLIDTGMAFAAQKVYDMYIFTPPGGTTIYWRIDNITDSTTAEGSSATNLPGTTTLMRFGNYLQTVNAVARNIRMQHIYLEQDR